MNTDAGKKHMQENMLKCLVYMSNSLTGGEYHMLVQKLLDVSEEVVEDMNLREELSSALSHDEASESEVSASEGCNQDHSHEHTHDHRYSHHMHEGHDSGKGASAETVDRGAKEGDSGGGQQGGLDEGTTGGDGKR